jgi:uncharacterized protein YidB (DUF937 family)
MGLLDSVLGAVTGGGGGGQMDIMKMVLGMVAGNSQGASGGGLADLVGKFQQGGLGDVVGSWIGHGQNQSISPDQLSGVLGSDAIGNIAQKLGISHGDAAQQISQVLPQVVDKLTPDGALPTGGLGNLSDLLGKFLPGSHV